MGRGINRKDRSNITEKNYLVKNTRKKDQNMDEHKGR